MTKKGRPTKADELARAWETIKAAGANGADTFDVKVVLIGIAADPKTAPTARISALRLLRDIELSIRNERALDEAFGK
jgi:hypothetical protein